MTVGSATRQKRESHDGTKADRAAVDLSFLPFRFASYSAGEKFRAHLREKFGLTIAVLASLRRELRDEIARIAVGRAPFGGLGTTAEHVRAAIRLDLPVHVVGCAWGGWEGHFASREAALSYRAARYHAEAERRALQRAIETNPFTIPQAIATARAFAAAIDALPVGRDIRQRLAAHLDEHIASLEALIEHPAK
jgi:hypothetical protein